MTDRAFERIDLPAADATEPSGYLRCAACGEMQPVKHLDALPRDVSGQLSLPAGSAWLVVYFCAGKPRCEEAALRRSGRWPAGLRVVPTDLPPR